MEIQRLDPRIRWQQMTAKEILKMRDQGEEVPSEFQKWAAAVSAVMNTQDDVTYEMVNGETDMAAIDEALGRDSKDNQDIAPTDDIENNIGKEDEDTEKAAEEKEDEEKITHAPTTEKEIQEQVDMTLADTSITTDPNEILKRKMRKGIEPSS